MAEPLPTQTVQPAQPIPPGVAPVAAAAPQVPGVVREQEVVAAPQEVKAPISEVVHPATTEVRVSPDVAREGVTPTPVTPKLEDQNLAQAAGETAPVIPSFPTQGTQATVTIQEVKRRSQSGSWKDSFRYYWSLIFKTRKKEEQH